MCEVKFLSPPPADAPTVAAAFPAASTLTKTGFRQWRGGSFLSSVPSLHWCSPVLGCCCCRLVTSALAALQKKKKTGKNEHASKKLLRLPTRCFPHKTAGSSQCVHIHLLFLSIKVFFFSLYPPKEMFVQEMGTRGEMIRISRCRHHKHQINIFMFAKYFHNEKCIFFHYESYFIGIAFLLLNSTISRHFSASTVTPELISRLWFEPCVSCQLQLIISWRMDVATCLCAQCKINQTCHLFSKCSG